MAIAERAKADPSATAVFSAQAAAHFSPHKNAVFYGASTPGHHFLLGAGYAREVNVYRMAHAVAREIMSSLTYFVFVADWNKKHEDTVEAFRHVNMDMAIVTRNGPTCFSGDSESFIDYVVTTPRLAAFVKVVRDFRAPWTPHVGLTIRLQGAIDAPLFTTLYKPEPLREALEKALADIPKYI